LLLEGSIEEEQMAVETESHAESAEELIGYHRHLMFREPLRVPSRKLVEEEIDTCHIQERIAEEFKSLIGRDALVREWI
jgi:hypothetical protein